MIENGFVYAVEKSLAKRRKQEAKDDKKADKFYSILNKYNTNLNDLRKDQMTKTELKLVLSYITENLKYPLTYYPNLQ